MTIRRNDHERHLERSRAHHARNRVARNEQAKKFRHSIDGKARFLYLSAKKRATERNHEFDISFGYVRLLLNLPCARSGLPFVFGGNGTKKQTPFAPSIDRRDNTKGYTVDNIQIVCNMFNRGKSDHDEIDFIAMCVAVADQHRNDLSIVARLKELRNAGL